jgi:membrane protease YdiL (CAAX protease family)
MSVSAIVLANLFGGSTPSPILSEEASHFPGPIAMVLNVAMLYIVLGLINGEELAWRGFALPRLHAKYNALTSSVILGAIWGLFHLPLFFTTTGSAQAGASFLPFVFCIWNHYSLYSIYLDIQQYKRERPTGVFIPRCHKHLDTRVRN